MSRPTFQTGGAPSSPLGSPEAVSGRRLFIGTAFLLCVVAVPVIVGGGPHLDDFARCVVPAQDGWRAYLDLGVDPAGIVRPAKFLEIGLLSVACDQVPFGLLIAVPLALTLLAGLALIGLLSDLDVPAPWPHVGGAAWLLHPLGAEAAWWPAALHIPLGLAFGLLALRAVRRRRWVATGLLTVGAYLCLEQALFALPLAAALVAHPRDRMRAGAIVGTASVVVIILYGLAPGKESLAEVSLLARMTSLFEDPAWLVRFPAKTIGLPAMAVAAWAWWPVTAVLVPLAAALGRRGGPALLPDGGAGAAAADRGSSPSWQGAVIPLLLLLALVSLLHLPMQSTVPRVESPRAFTPSWLALAAFGAWAASRVRWRRPRPLGALGLVIAALCLQTLAFQAVTRAATARIEAQVGVAIADRTADGDRLALCDVPVTVVEPALRWVSYSQHAYLTEHVTRHAIRYHSGRRLDAVAIRTDGCPEPAGAADVIIGFDGLVAD